MSVFVPNIVDISSLVNNKPSSALYHTFDIPKYKKTRKGKVVVGYRTITAPCKELKELQRALMSELRNYDPFVHPAAYAYRQGRSVVNNAAQHVGRRYRLRIDLKDFFPSVTTHMVNKQLSGRNIPRWLVTAICNWCFLGGVLPQGAPSSPLLSNIAMVAFDTRVAKLMQTWRKVGTPNLKIAERKVRSEPITYTRYCDDLVFSSNYPYLPDLVATINLICGNFRLVINTNKTNVSKHTGRQVVTGVVVNSQLSIARNVRQNMRAEIHNLIMDCVTGKCAKNTFLQDGEERPLGIGTDDRGSAFASLLGRVGHVKHVNAKQGHNLECQLAVLVDVHTKEEFAWSAQTTDYLNKRAANVLCPKNS